MAAKKEPIYLLFKEFIEVFENPEQHKERIEELKSKGSSITLLMGRQENHSVGLGSDNFTIEGEQLEALKRANENAKKEKFRCRFLEGFSVEESIVASTKIEDWVKEIQSTKRINGEPLSPFEKVIYAMEICTEFYYNEEKRGANSRLSRNVNKVLNGDKIVCAGYAALMCKILEGCGIGCDSLTLLPTDKKKHGHATCLIYLEDRSYGINGFMICEPTWASRRAKLNGAKYRFGHYAFLTLDQAREMYKEEGLEFSDFFLQHSKDYALHIAKPELAALHDDYEKQEKPYHPIHVQEKIDEKRGALLEKAKQLLKEARKEVPTPTEEKGPFLSDEMEMIAMNLIFGDSEDFILEELKNCCKQASDEEILSAVEAGIKTGIFSKYDDMKFGTEQDKIAYDELFNREAKPPTFEQFILISIVSVCRAKNMTMVESVAHACALMFSLDKEKEEFCVKYFTEHGTHEESRKQALRLIRKMNKNKESEVPHEEQVL